MKNKKTKKNLTLPPFHTSYTRLAISNKAVTLRRHQIEDPELAHPTPNLEFEAKGVKASEPKSGGGGKGSFLGFSFAFWEFELRLNEEGILGK